jgi:hypothetical protein
MIQDNIDRTRITRGGTEKCVELWFEELTGVHAGYLGVQSAGYVKGS